MLDAVIPAAEFFIVVAFALAAVLLKTINGRGFLASVVVGLSIVFGGGPSWFVIVAVFFALGVAFTLYAYGYIRDMGTAQEKGGVRSWPNIMANGGVASVVALVNILKPELALSALFLGAISTSAADTVATELGLLSRGKPRLITSPKKVVPPGTSGGVTPLGVMGALFASLVIGSMALFLGVGQGSMTVVLVCVVGGIFGACFDSMLGAAVQRKGHCVICLKPTEALKHCGESTHVAEGLSCVENNVVNLIATAAGAAAALIVYLAFMT